MSMTIKLAINATCLLSPFTGIGQYTYHLGKQMLADPEVSPHFFYGMYWSKALRQASVPGIGWKKNVVKKIVPQSYAVTQAIKKIQFSRGVPEVDIYHEPTYLPLSFKQKIVLTVHDISFVRYPETHPAQRITAMKKFPQALARAGAIITDSHYTAKELIDCFDVDAEKVYPIHLGVTDEYHLRSEDEVKHTLLSHGLSYQQYILVVGTLEPRKNLQLVFAAYSKLPDALKKRFPLVVVGMRGWETEKIDESLAVLLSGGYVKILGYVLSEDLPLIYAGAKLFVYPSLYEGFGLPPLEAMASGVPVITSNRSSIPEVVGSAGVQIDAEDAMGLKHSMLELLDDENKCQVMRLAGLEQSKKFTWEKCAAATVDVYKKVIG